MEIIAGIIFSLIVFGIIYSIKDYIERKSSERSMEHFYREQAQMKEKIEKAKEREAFIDSKYGRCTKSLCKDDDQYNTVRVYEDAKILVINDKPYRFSDIIRCAGTYVPKNNLPPKTVTTTNIGNMAARGVVGGLLFGPAGAVVGAATAKKTTKICQEEEIRRLQIALHDETFRTGNVNIYLKSIAEPIVQIKCYKREEEQICAVINAIIAQN